MYFFFRSRRSVAFRVVLNERVTKTLVISLILCKLDYCNTLLASLPKDLVKSLQLYNYKATVAETTSNNKEKYTGLTENEFKTRFNLHKSSFKLEHKRTSTTLSDHIKKTKTSTLTSNVRSSKR